jgi:uncharacterized delta-60 repeat protein
MIKKRKPVINVLEPRILFDGAAVETAVDVLDNSSFEKQNSDTSDDNSASIQPTERNRKEIAFVDKSLQDYQVLVDGIDDGVEVYLIDSIEQIANVLRVQNDLDSIHILSHGNTGSVTIGFDTLDSNTLNNYSKELNIIKDALNDEGDILLYGCNVAQNSDGEEFITKLADITQADIKASDDITGSSELGGDWELEISKGNVEAVELVVNDWDGHLGDQTTATYFSGYTVTNSTQGRATVYAYTDSSLSDKLFDVKVTGYYYGGYYNGYTNELEGHSQGHNFEQDFDVGYATDDNGTGYLDDETWDARLSITANTDADFKYFVLNSIDVGYVNDTSTKIRAGNSNYSQTITPSFGTKTPSASTYSGYGSAFEGELTSSINFYTFVGSGTNTESFSGSSDTDIRIDNIKITPKYKPKIDNFANETLDYSRGTEMLIDSDATITLDADYSNGFDGGAIYAMISNKQTGDELRIDTSNGIALSAGMSGGSVVSVDGIDVGTIHNSYYGSGSGNSQNLLINFNTADATEERVEKVLQSLQYYNADPNIDETNRTFKVQVRDTLTYNNNAKTLDYSNYYEKTFNILPNTAPTMTTVGTLSGAVEDTAFSISHSDLAAISNEADTDPVSTVGFRIEAINDGTITKNGVAITEGTTAIMPGDTIEWTPSNNTNGTGINAFSIKAWDGFDASDTALDVLIDVSAVNDAPTINDISDVVMTKDTVFELPLSGSDIEDDTLSWSVDSITGADASDIASTSVVGNIVKITPTTGASGLKDIVVTVKANDGNGGITTKSFNISRINTAPVLDDIANMTIAEDSATTTIALSSTDAEADAVTYSVSGGSSSTIIATVDGNNLFITPATNFYTTDTAITLTVTAHDIYGATHSKSFDITVTGVNEAPSFIETDSNGNPKIGFGGDGTVITSIDSGDDKAYDSLIQSDGKVVVAGLDSDKYLTIVRYNIDGSLDTTFDSDGIVQGTYKTSTDWSYGKTVSIAQQSDGKLVAVVSNDDDIFIYKFNSDGSLYTSFSDDGLKGYDWGKYQAKADRIIIQPDGKILVAGDVKYPDGIDGQTYTSRDRTDWVVMRINADTSYSVDTTFGGDGYWTYGNGSYDYDYIYDMQLQSDGKIIVMGSLDKNNINVARLNANGTLDTTFGTSGFKKINLGSSDVGYQMAIQDDGKIVIVGEKNNDIAIIRLNTDGSFDNTFSDDGYLIENLGNTDELKSVAIQPDGKIVVAGYTNSSTYTSGYYDYTVLRYNSDGTLDTTFANDGVFTHNLDSSSTQKHDYAHSVKIASNGDIVVSGYATIGSYKDFATLRIDIDGNLKVASANTLDATPTYTENSDQIIIDNDVKIYDNDLQVLNNLNGDFTNSSLTLVRNGGANSEDLFGIDTTNAMFTIDGANIQYNGQTFATYSYSSGTMSINFTSLQTVATTTLVNNVLSHITYANSSENPSSSVDIDWTFDDGNVTAQGSGGAKDITQTITINITAVNDAPILDDIPNQTLAENSTSSFTLSSTDAEGEAISYEVSTDGTNWSSSAGGSLLLTITNNTVSINPVQNYSNDLSPMTFMIRAVDASGGVSESKTFTVTVEGINSTPEYGLGDGIFSKTAYQGATTGQYNYIEELDDGSILVGYHDTSKSGQAYMIIDANGTDTIGGQYYNSAYSWAYHNTRGLGFFDITDNTYTSAKYMMINNDGYYKYTNGNFSNDIDIGIYNSDGNRVQNFDFDTEDENGDNLNMSSITATTEIIGGKNYIYVVGFSSSRDGDDISYSKAGKIYAYKLRYDGNNLTQVGSTTVVDVNANYNDEYIGGMYAKVVGGSLYVATSSERYGSQWLDTSSRVYKFNIGSTSGSLSYSSNLNINLSTVTSKDQYTYGFEEIDNKLYLFGKDNANNNGWIAKVNTNNTLDTTFGTDGILTMDPTSWSEGVVALADGKDGKLIAVVEGLEDNKGQIVRLNSDGSIDPTFSIYEYDTSSDFATGNKKVLVKSDGTIIVTISARTGSVPGVISLNSNGTINTAFHAPYALNGTPSYTEDGASVVLDSSVNINDIELDQLNSGDGDYKGAYLEISRDGGANIDDKYEFKDGNVDGKTLTFDTDLKTIMYNSNVFATYTNDNGTLKINFTSTDTPASTALVNNLMTRIKYYNSSDTPDTTVKLNWAFSDGNTDTSQGSGGELKALGSTTVTITPVNDNPIFNNDTTINTDEDTSKSITLDSTDPESETMTYSIITNGNSSTVLASLDTNTLTFTPATNYNGGPVNITVRVTDASGGYADKTFAVTVNSINDAPVVDMGTNNLQSERTASNSDASFFIDTFSISDVEDNSSGNVTVVLSTKDMSGTNYGNITLKTNVSGGISSSQISGNGTGTVTITSTIAKINQTLSNASGLKYSVNSGFDYVASGADMLSMSVTDTDGDTTTKTKQVFILPAKPTAHSQNYTIDEDTTSLSIDLSALVTDINGTNAQYTLGTGTVSDNNGNGGSITSFGGDESNWSNSLGVGNLNDDNANSFHDGVFTYVPTANANGTDTFLYQFTNSGGNSEIAQISIYVLPVNDNPVLDAIPNQTMIEDTPIELTLNSTDVENEDITYTVTGGSDSTVKATIVDNKLTLTPAQDYETSTPITFTVTATDESGGTHTQTFTTTVTAVADDPRMDDINNQILNEDTPKKITLNGYDPDGNSISYSLIDAGDDNTVKATLNGNELTLTPALNYYGKDINITVRITDSTGAYSDKSFLVAVQEINDAPILDNIANQTLTEDTPMTIALSSSDVENDEVTYTISGGNPNGIVGTINGNQLTLTPALDFYTSTPISFTVTATDARGGVDTKTFTAIVNAVNDAPNITTIADQTLTEDISKSVAVTATDPEGNAITFSVSGGSDDTVTAHFEGSNLIFTPAKDFNTTTTIDFVVTATDSVGDSSTQVVKVTVNAVNDAPVTSINQNNFYTERADNNPSATVDITDIVIADVDDSDVTVIISSKDVGGGDYYGNFTIDTTINGGIDSSEVTNNGTGVITINSTVEKINKTLSAINGLLYTPDDGKDYIATGADEFKVTTIDGDGEPHSQSRNIYVIPAAPTANSRNYVLNEDDPSYLIDLSQIVIDLNQTAPNFTLGSHTYFEATNTIGDNGAINVPWQEANFVSEWTYATFSDDAPNTFDDGKFIYTPKANQNGSDVFFYQYESSGESSEVAQIMIYLLPVNDAPTLANISAQTFAENTVNSTAQILDSDITYDDVDNLDLDGGSLSITGLRASETVSIQNQDIATVGNIQLSGDELQVSDGTNWTTFGKLSGGNASDLKVDFNSNATVSVVDDLMKIFTYQSRSELGETAHDLIIKIDDGDGATTLEHALSVGVTSENDNPVLGNIGDVDVNYGQSMTITLSSSDVENDLVTYSVTGGSSSTIWGVVDGNLLTFYQDENFDGSDTVFVVTATDSNGGTHSETINVIINNPPTIDNKIQNQTFSGEGDWTYTIPADTFSDPEGSSLTYSVSELPSWLEFDANTREFRGNPPANQTPLDISITAIDGNNLKTTDTFKVTFNNTNDNPEIANPIPDQTFSGEGDWVFEVPTNTFSDKDINDIVFNYESKLSNGEELPKWLSFDKTKREFKGNPPANQTPLNINVTATDANGLSITDTFIVSFSDVNDTPEVNNPISDQTFSGEGDWVFEVPIDTFSDKDIDDTTFSYESKLLNGEELPAWLSFDKTKREFKGNPPANQTALDINVTATDANGLSITDTFTVSFSDVNDTPEVNNPISDQTFSGEGDWVFEVPIDTFSDKDIDDTTFSYESKLSNGEELPKWLSFDKTKREFKGNPPANQTPLNIGVTATDANGLSITDTFKIVFNNVNDLPTVISDTNIDEEMDFGNEILKDISPLFDDVDYQNVFKFDAENLPKGIEIDKVTGIISGQAKESGEFVIKITGTDSGKDSISRSFKLIIHAPPIEEIKTNSDKLFENKVKDSILNVQKKVQIDRTKDTLDNRVETESIKIASPNKDVVNDIPYAKNVSTDVNVVVDYNGQVSFEHQEVTPFDNSGLSIGKIDYKMDYIEMKVLDSQNNQVYIVTLKDGSPLPKSLSFDEKTGILSGKLPVDMQNLSIKIKAISIDGSERELNVKIANNDLRTSPQKDDIKYSDFKDKVKKHSFNMKGYGKHIAKVFSR